MLFPPIEESWKATGLFRKERTGRPKFGISNEHRRWKFIRYLHAIWATTLPAIDRKFSSV